MRPTKYERCPRCFASSKQSVSNDTSANAFCSSLQRDKLILPRCLRDRSETACRENGLRRQLHLVAPAGLGPIERGVGARDQLRRAFPRAIFRDAKTAGNRFNL